MQVPQVSSPSNDLRGKGTLDFMDEYTPSAQDMAFMCTVALVLEAVADSVRKIGKRKSLDSMLDLESDVTTGWLNQEEIKPHPTAQEIQARALQWVDSSELYDEMAAGAYRSAYTDGFTRFVQDYRTVLARFLVRYERDQNLLQVILPFTGGNGSPSDRERFVTALWLAHLAAVHSSCWTPQGGQLEESGLAYELYKLLSSLFGAGEDKGKE